MKKIKSTLPLKAIGIVLAIIFTLSVVLVYAWGLLRDSEYFRVKEVVVKGNDKAELSYFKGRNILNLNSTREARSLMEAYPNYSSVSIIRVLPNRLFISFVARKPLALVKLYRYFSLDEEGAILYTDMLPGDTGLPVITGLETKIFGVRPGKRYDLKEIRLALAIIKEFQRARLNKDYRIKRIDVANPENASIFIVRPAYSQGTLALEEIEVKLGQENIREKLAILASLVKQNKNEAKDLSYVDLRFKEPVIKLRNGK